MPQDKKINVVVILIWNLFSASALFPG